MTIIAAVGGPQAYSSASGGKVYAYNALTTTPANVAPANPSRRTIRFHNPGTVDIYIAPALAYTSATSTTPATLTPSTVAKGGVFTVYANGGTLDITGECQGIWQAFAASGTGNPLTVMDSNI